MNYYEHHIGDYAEATAHLSFVEDAAYSRLIRKYYASEKPLPVEIKAVQRLVGARTKEEKEAVGTILDEFFELRDDGWHNTRCDEEIARYQDKQAKAKRSADARWSKSKTHSEGSADEIRTHSEGSADEMRTHSEGNAHQTPDTRHQTPSKPLTSGDVDSTGSSSSETQPAAVRFAVLIRGWEKARGKVVALTAADPRVVAWADASVTEEQLQLAYEMAKDARELEGDTTPINAGFLDVFVAKVLKPATGGSAVGKLPPAKPWFLSSSAIEAKGEELGIQKFDGEQWHRWRDRVYAAAGVTDEMIRRAKIDAGEKV